MSKELLYPLIENALEGIRPHLRVDGGDVEFVNEGILKEYQKIALLEYY